MDLTVIIKFLHLNALTELRDNIAFLISGLLSSLGDYLYRAIFYFFDPNHPLAQPRKETVDSIPPHPDQNDARLKALYAGQEYHGRLAVLFEDGELSQPDDLTHNNLH